MVLHGDGGPASVVDLVRCTSDAIVGETLDGTVTVWNRAAEALYGYPAPEMLGRPADRLYPPGRRAEESAAVRQVADGRRFGPCVTERIHRDGTAIAVSVRAAPLVDDAGATIGIATVSWAMDPAGPRARIGHELRTSLNAIIGFTGTLLMRLPGPLNDEQEHQLRLVQSSAETLLSRVNELARSSEQ